MQEESKNQIISLNYHIMGQTGEHKTAQDTTVQIKMKDGDIPIEWLAKNENIESLSLSKDLGENSDAWLNCLAFDAIGTPQEVFNSVASEMLFVLTCLTSPQADLDEKKRRSVELINGFLNYAKTEFVSK